MTVSTSTTTSTTTPYASLEDMFCYALTGNMRQSRFKKAELGPMRQADLPQQYFYNNMPVLERPGAFWMDFERLLQEAQSNGSRTLELIEFKYTGDLHRVGLDSRQQLLESFQVLGDLIDKVLVIRSTDWGLPHSYPQHHPAVHGVQVETWRLMKPSWLHFLGYWLNAPVSESEEKIAGSQRTVFTIDLVGARVLADYLQDRAKVAV